MKKNFKNDKKCRGRLGTILIVWPWVTIVSVLVFYGVLSNTVMYLASSAPDGSNLALSLRIVSTFIGLIGTLAMVGIFVSTPFGAYLLSTPPSIKK